MFVMTRKPLAAWFLSGILIAAPLVAGCASSGTSDVVDGTGGSAGAKVDAGADAAADVTRRTWVGR